MSARNRWAYEPYKIAGSLPTPALTVGQGKKRVVVERCRRKIRERDIRMYYKRYYNFVSDAME